MTRDQFNAFCEALPATSHVVQWGDADVWKVGGARDGKVFAIGRFGDGKYAGITFKVSPLAFEILKEQPGLRPAPYFASRGITWIQQYDASGLPDPVLGEHLEASHRLVIAGLTKTKRRELNLD